MSWKVVDVNNLPSREHPGGKRILYSSDTFHMWLHTDPPGVIRGRVEDGLQQFHRHFADEMFFCMQGELTMMGGMMGHMQPGMQGMMQPGMMQPDMMGQMQPGMMQPGTMQPGAVMQPGTMQPGAFQPGAMMQPWSSASAWSRSASQTSRGRGGSTKLSAGLPGQSRATTSCSSRPAG